MPSSAPDSNDELIAQFLREHAVAPDRAGHLMEWQRLHPHLAEELPALASMEDRLHQSRPADEALPKQLGEFQIVRRLGASMGEVFEAWQPSLNRKVAVKTIRRGHISAHARNRFLREQKVLAGLHQTHIVPIHAAGEEAGLQYFVMPYIDGAALHHVVHTAREGAYLKIGHTPPLKELAQKVADSEVGHAAPPIVPQETTSLKPAAPPPAKSSTPARPHLDLEYFRSVAQVMADAADALQFAHDADILHRDIKPSNFMVDRQGHCWIIDFGLAEVLKKAETADVRAAAAVPAAVSPHTISGIMGTPPYMAPEQWSSRADFRTDVYGLGVTLYELLTLSRAFVGADNDEIKAKMLAAEPTRPCKLVPNLPADLDAICGKAMNKDPGKRYDSPKAVAADLRCWLNGFPTGARPAQSPRRLWYWAKRNKGWAAAILLSLIFSISTAAGVITAQLIENEAQRKEIQAEEEMTEIERKGKQEALREIVIRDAQSLRMAAQRQAGWFEKSWKLLGEAAHIRVDDHVRNEAATCIIGLDVVSAKKFRNEGACALAFHPSGRKLILGAQPATKNGREPKKPAQPIRIWDQDTELVKDTTLFDVGPVAYDKQGKPLALTVKKQEPALVLWDLETEKPLRELTFPPKTKGQVVKWALSADGATAAARVPFDKEESLIVAWDTATGKTLHQESKKTTSVIALSPDGKFLAAGDAEGRVEVWSLEKKNPPVFCKTGRLGISALAFGANLRRSPGEMPWILASGDQGGTITLWDLANQSVRGLLQGSAHDVLALEFNPDGVLLASSGRSEPHLWNVATGKILLELPFHDYATSLAFSPQGNRLAIANFHSPFFGLDIQVFQIENGRGLKSYHGLSGQIQIVEFSKDGSRLAALSHQWQIGVWDTKTGGLLHVFQPRPGLYADNAGLALSDDNQTLAFTTSQHAYLWDLRTAKEQAFALPPGMVDRLAFHGGLGKYLSFRVETEDGKEWPLRAKSDFRQHPRVCRIRSFSPAGLENIAEIKAFNKSVVSAGMARNASVIAVEGFAEDQKGLTRTVRIYSLPDCKVLWSDSSSPKYPGGGTMLHLDPEGNVLFWNSASDKLEYIRPRLVDLKTRHAEDWQLFPLCLGPQGNFALVLSAGPTRGVSFHRGPTKTPLASFSTNHSADQGTQFSRQGTHFAWGTTDGTLIHCDIAATQAKLAEIGLGWE